jgi:soluble lytic murein transglycosylase-like protein
MKTLFAEGPGRRGIIALSLAGWLLMVVVIAKMFLGCSTNLQQATVQSESQAYKISESPLNVADATVKITLPSCLNRGFVFLEKNIFTDDSQAGTAPSAHDVSALAKIGQSPTDSSVVKKAAPLSRSTLLNPVIVRAASQHQVDPALVRAIIFAESGYNPTAVSDRGAMGLMQLMPATAKAMGVEDCFDPEHNINGGVKYFKKLFVQFDGDVKLALAAYNAGSRKVRQFNGVPPFRATEHYIKKVLKYYKIYQGQQVQQVGLS